MASLCLQASTSPGRHLISADGQKQDSSTWLLKANVTVFRHADRTPKQKLKFSFPVGEAWTQPFVALLNGEREEIILREQAELRSVAAAVDEAKALGASGDDFVKLSTLNTVLFNKIELPGTKAQLKPVYSKKHAGQARALTKLTLVFKWGGEFTHSARYQSRDLGENMKKDISIMSMSSKFATRTNVAHHARLSDKDALNNVKVRAQTNSARHSAIVHN
jgi:inositol hexakisphosphate/diphosphoinositol-pentakisphosphate kinase